ncbi:MAG: protein kinase domain-containing protein [Chthoniobacterales bacterium]
MEAKIYLKRYRLHLDQFGLPVVIRRSATEATFRGEDLRTGESVALQVVPVEALSTIVREEWEAEAKTARELKHINIPVLHDFGFEDGQMIYVTEYFDGTTAADWVKSRGPMPVGAVLRIGQQVVNASSLATFRGIVHRAINPSNIMLVPGQTTEGEWPLIKVLNFVGVAPNLAPSNSTDHEAFNSTQFASPEQIQDGAVGFRSQVYSLGATLSFLLTGAAPIEDAGSLDDASRVPVAVKKLLAQMLAANPSERPLDPLALQAQIQDCLAQRDRPDAVATRLEPPLASQETEPINLSWRPFPWRPVTLAAILFALATISAVALSGHFKRAPVGVQIVVPKNSATSRVSASPVIAAQNSASAAIPKSVVVAPARHWPPVVTATESAKEKEAATGASTEAVAASLSSQPKAAAQPTVSQPVQIAVVQSSPPASTVQRASSPNERLPKAAEGPSPLQEKKAVVQNRKEEEATPAKAKPRETKPDMARSNERQRSGRAQFLGLTPDGNLVFGLPSSEKVSIAPPAEGEPREKPRNQARRPPPPETIDGLPVLPALPPDQ